MFRVLHADGGGDAGAPIAALGEVAAVAEACHELGPCMGNSLHAPAGLGRLAGEAVAGNGGDDEVERIRCIAAVGGGVGQGPDNLQELDDGAGPAMREDQGLGVVLGRANVQKVDVHTVDVGDELWQCIDARLHHPPVVALPPVRAELLHVGEGDALTPVGNRLGLRPPRARQPLFEVPKGRVGNLNLERLYGIRHDSQSSSYAQIQRYSHDDRITQSGRCAVANRRSLERRYFCQRALAVATGPWGRGHLALARADRRAWPHPPSRTDAPCGA